MSSTAASSTAATNDEEGAEPFADEPSQQEEGSTWPTTFDEAKRGRKFVIKGLREATGTDDTQTMRGIANSLEHCRRANRCGEEACDVCRRLRGRRLTRAAKTAVANWVASQRVVAQRRGANRGMKLAQVTIIPSIKIRRGTKKHLRRQLNEIHKQLHDALDEAGVAFAIGYFDVSHNEHEDGEWAPYFCFHLHAVMPYHQAKAGEPVLNRRFPNTAAIRDAVKMKPFDASGRGYSYIFKDRFERRITLPAHRRADGTWKRQNTRGGKPLTVEQRNRLFVILHHLGSDARLFLHGAGITEKENGRLTIRLGS